MPKAKRLMHKTVQVPGRDYFMAVYENGDGYFSKDGTNRTATSIAELESEGTSDGWRQRRDEANTAFRDFGKEEIFADLPWKPTE